MCLLLLSEVCDAGVVTPSLTLALSFTLGVVTPSLTLALSFTLALSLALALSLTLALPNVNLKTNLAPPPLTL